MSVPHEASQDTEAAISTTRFAARKPSRSQGIGPSFLPLLEASFSAQGVERPVNMGLFKIRILHICGFLYSNFEHIQIWHGLAAPLAPFCTANYRGLGIYEVKGSVPVLFEIALQRGEG